jgi:formamidopyrimidine-DNA glycosylase
MPELPEVETLCRQLQQTIAGACIEELDILDQKLGRPEKIAGLRVRSAARHGKQLSMHLDDNRVLYLHLRMSGRLLWQNHAEIIPPHTRFMMRFAHGRLICIDPRRFATLSINAPKRQTALILDPLKAFSTTALSKAARRTQRPVKTLLLDQNIIAGIGNIYACEMLYQASVSPRRPACSLSSDEMRRLARAGRNILQEATQCRGTSISDWRDLYGKKGEYQYYLVVYGRKGLACFGCGKRIVREVIGGRGTYYCAACQT